MTTPTKDSKIKELETLENKAKGNNQQGSTVQPPYKENIEINGDTDNPNILDGYIPVTNNELPQNGVLYPESWKFAHRSPTAKEVATFSTLQENDHPGILAAVEDLIRKCVVIFDINTQKQISTGQINDCHRTYFLLKLRDHYLPGSPIEYERICGFCKETTMTKITAQSLKFTDLSEKLLENFDGRMFTLPYPELEEPIQFLIPTIEISSRIFKYIVRVAQEKEKSGETKGLEDKLIYDKKFLLIAPYLYLEGNESMKVLGQRYKALEVDEPRYKRYVEIATQLKLDNLDEVDGTCDKCGAVEAASLRFPGGWKCIFTDKNNTAGYY